MNDVHWSVSLIVSIFPLIMLVAAIMWAGRTVAKELRTKDGRSLAILLAAHLEEIERKNERLDRAVADHGNRLDALERK